MVVNPRQVIEIELADCIANRDQADANARIAKGVASDRDLRVELDAAIQIQAFCGQFARRCFEGLEMSPSNRVGLEISRGLCGRRRWL